MEKNHALERHTFNNYTEQSLPAFHMTFEFITRVDLALIEVLFSSAVIEPVPMLSISLLRHGVPQAMYFLSVGTVMSNSD